MENKVIKKSKYSNETGVVLTEYYFKINKESKKAEFKEIRMKVLVSNEKQYVVENINNVLEIIEKYSKKDYQSHRTLNKCIVSEFNWNSRSLEDYLYCRFITTMSRKTAINKMKRELLKYCKTKLYFFTESIMIIEEKLN